MKIKKAQTAQEVEILENIPNIGTSIADDLRQIGIKKPTDLVRKNPYQLFEKLCRHIGKEIDPCVADVFISAVRFMEGEASKPWWFYTKERKKYFCKKRIVRDGS